MRSHLHGAAGALHIHRRYALALVPVSGGDEIYPIRSPIERELEHRNVL
jgi:hypothetical protein